MSLLFEFPFTERPLLGAEADAHLVQTQVVERVGQEVALLVYLVESLLCLSATASVRSSFVYCLSLYLTLVRFRLFVVVDAYEEQVAGVLCHLCRILLA